RYRELDNLNDLEASVKHFQVALDLTPEGHSDREDTLQDLGGALTERYRRLGDLADMEAALKADQEVVDLTPPDHPDRAGRLQGLAASFRDRYQRLDDLEDLEAALRIKQEAVDLTLPRHPDRAGHLQSLAVSFRDRYQRLGELKDLEAALEADQEAVDLTPPDHPDRSHHLQSLAVSFGNQYQRLGDLKDLEAALQNYQEALDLTPPGHPNRARRFQGLATSFRDRHKTLGDLKDLEAALQNYQEALDLTPPGHPDQAHRLQGLASSFTDRYQRLGDLKDLEAALQNYQEALDLTPPGHPNQAHQLRGLAICLGNKYRRLGNLKDLEAALKADQEVVDLTPPDHPDRAGRLQGLAVSFKYRYMRLGDLKDLEVALQTDQEAVDLTPLGHPERAGRLQALAVSFRARYHRLGDLKDLEAAQQTDQEAVDLTPPGHPDRARRLQALAVSFGDRYKRLDDLKDLEAALQIEQEAVDLTPPEHPERAGQLQVLAVSFGDRYQRFGDLKDLEAALQTDQKAVDLTPPGHPERAGRLQALATSFRDLYKTLGDLKDLEAALQTDQEAVDLTPPGHPERAGRLQALAVSFTYRYKRLRRLEDRTAVQTHYNESFKLASDRPEISWEQALSWANFAREFEPDDCIHVFNIAFNLLPEILWIGHSIPVRHDALHRLDISGATSTAVRTCIDLMQFHVAVEFLEQGLATIFQQMLQLKPDVDALRPDEAGRFFDLSSRLYSGQLTESPIGIVEDRKKLLDDIRKQPGFESFLLPRSYNVLCHAAQGGPVIILTSHKAHCDAIILCNPTSDPVHVPLQAVTLDLLISQRDMLTDLLRYCNVRNRGQSSSSRLFGRRKQFAHKPAQGYFQDLLNWLWINVSGPIYAVLKSHDISNGRLWWLPTGAFSGLPFHASPPTDEFIHSYTATLGSLLDAYKKSSHNAPKLAVVGVTHTDSNRSNSLKGVELEVDKILSIAKDYDVRCLLGNQAKVDAVKLQLQDCSWVHLACHGYQNFEYPTQSHLRLYGGKLELDTILRMPLPNAQFVFLAACQTAMGDVKLVNESFHLGGGFITAGFKSAIGTMWSMNDSDGTTVAEIVYCHLFREGQQPTHTDTAEALQLAVKELKSRKVPYERWVPFIHIGI
ncbi:CHAT domain-containing protein, partial [Mycena rebaudengoi]